MTQRSTDLTTCASNSLVVAVRQEALAIVQGEIAACTLCVSAGFIPAARPVFRGHAGQRLMVVGQAPGPSSGQRGVPYTGATGTALQAWLERAGFGEGALHRDCYLTSLTKCFPGPARSGGKGDRPPSAAEIALCSRHLDREIALVRPDIVLSLGRLATERLDPTARRLPLHDLVGSRRPVERAGHPFFLLPLPHPSGVSRWLNDLANRVRLEEALSMLRRGVEMEKWQDGKTARGAVGRESCVVANEGLSRVRLMTSSPYPLPVTESGIACA